MSLENLHIAKSALTDTVYVGYINNDGKTWRKKNDVTDEFLTAVVDWWNGCSQEIIASNGKVYKITVERISNVVRGINMKSKETTEMYCTNFVDELDCETLIAWADLLNVPPNDNYLTDEEMSDNNADELRIVVAEAMEKVGK